MDDLNTSHHLTGASVSGNDDTIVIDCQQEGEEFANIDTSFSTEKSSVFATSHQSFKNFGPKRGKQEILKGKENNDDRWTFQSNNNNNNNNNNNKNQENKNDKDNEEDEEVNRDDRCASCGKSVSSNVGVLFSIESKSKKNFQLQSTRKTISDSNISKNNLFDSKLSGNKLSSKKKWHLECFRCSICNESLEYEKSCFEFEDKILCKSDYAHLQLSTTSSSSSSSRHNTNSIKCTCATCNWPISSSDWVRRARGFVYHLACFTCHLCSRQLNTGEQFALDWLDRQTGVAKLICRCHFGANDILESSNQQINEQQCQDNQTNNSNTWNQQQQQQQQQQLDNQSTSSQISANNNRHLINQKPTTSNNDNNINVNSQLPMKTKRVRTTFTEDQLQVLQTNFKIDSNPDGQDLERIASDTGLSKRVTQVWFQNSRARQKKYMTKRRPTSSSLSSSLAQQTLQPTTATTTTTTSAQTSEVDHHHLGYLTPHSSSSNHHHHHHQLNSTQLVRYKTSNDNISHFDNQQQPDSPTTSNQQPESVCNQLFICSPNWSTSSAFSASMSPTTQANESDRCSPSSSSSSCSSSSSSQSDDEELSGERSSSCQSPDTSHSQLSGNSSQRRQRRRQNVADTNLNVDQR